MKELAILRHGESPMNAPSDYDRGLSLDGIECVRRNVVNLERAGFRPDLILASSARRALATAEIAREVYGFDPEILVARRDLYECDLVSIHRGLREEGGEAAALLLVGHNPGLSTLAMQLNDQVGGLAPADVVWMKLPIVDWAEAAMATADETQRFGGESRP